MPNDSKVVIRVFDALGKLVKELVNEYKSSGNYSVIFDGINLASGMYFYRIETDRNTTVKRMLLIK